VCVFGQINSQPFPAHDLNKFIVCAHQDLCE